MTGEYEKAISIKEAIDAIHNRDYLLPAIQRKFVWKNQQICILFDSIMRGYPINTFMMWEITESHIKNNYKFYEFLKDYCQKFEEENPPANHSASLKNFKAIIDGQQRLTSLYIGLYGTYAYKQPRLWWPSTRDENIFPRRKLYLDLKQQVISEDDDDSLMMYNFKFLTEKQYQNSLGDSNEHYWFCLHEIPKFPQLDNVSDILIEIVIPFLKSAGLPENEFAQKTLLLLYEVIRLKKIIHYFNEPSQEIDHVLDIFIRTNSGGTTLAFSDLLMSIAVANWDGDFRQELVNLTRYIHESNNMGFDIDRNWILKTCLMLTDADVRFKVKNFKEERVKKIQSEWTAIKECIKSAFLLVHRFGINPQSLTSRNTVIPICYYLYKHTEGNQPLYHAINNLAKCHEQRAKISQWFYMALLKGVFGGSSDSILISMREVLKANIQKPLFPLEDIIDRYKTTNKDLRFNDDYIESLLNIQHGEGRCRALLHLLFPEMNSTEIFHIDHLHPHNAFGKKALKSHNFLQADDELYEFFSDKRHWNSMANLHLLNGSQNRSKSDKPLDEWLNDQHVNLRAQDLFVEESDLEFEAFRQFYEKRRAKLKERLKSRVFMSAQLPLTDEDSDEEVLEDSPV